MNARFPSLSHPYDLVVIGGGINGAAIARDAALRGLKVILFEKEDFGSGASTKTSKLAHGGLRYLEQFQLRLVHESLRERALLLKNAPHLVQHLPFLFPVYSGEPRPLWQVNLGLVFYDLLAGKERGERHQKLSAEELVSQVSGLKTDGLVGGCSYLDAQMQDHRVLIETILSAEEAGAQVYNYVEVIGLLREGNQVTGVKIRHVKSGREEEIRGKVVVNATGAWSATISGMEPGVKHPLPAPTKGVHIAVPQLLADTALILRAPQDGRVFFILPWDNMSLVGTTDTFFDGDPDQLSVDSGDQQYLLDALNAFFPDKHFTEADVKASFAGLRPLVAPQTDQSPSEIARGHVIQVSTGGLVTVLGGKYTTHRQIAEEVVDGVVSFLPNGKSFLPCATKTQLFPGASGEFSLTETADRLRAAGIDEEGVMHLMTTYGTRSLKILALMQQDPSQRRKMSPDHPHVLAELTYGIQAEHVKTLEDWLFRRSHLGYLKGPWTA